MKKIMVIMLISVILFTDCSENQLEDTLENINIVGPLFLNYLEKTNGDLEKKEEYLTKLDGANEKLAEALSKMRKSKERLEDALERANNTGQTK